MKTLLLVFLLLSFNARAQTTNSISKYLGVYLCQNAANVTIDLRSDGSAATQYITVGMTWKEKKDTIEVLIREKPYATFKKEGRDLINEKTGTRYVKVREFQ